MQLLQLAFQLSTILTVFGFGLAAGVEDVLHLVRHPRMLLISLVSMFSVMPFVALGLAWVFDPPQLARVALVALALSPVPPMLLGKARRAAGRASYALGLTATVSILSIVLVPALVEFLGALMSRPFQLGPLAVASQVLVAVVLPLAAGMLVRAFLPRVAERVEKPFAKVANVGLAFGHILAGPEPGDSAVLALSSALRHPGIALGLASGNFPSLDFGAVIILYLLTAAVVCTSYSKWMNKRAAARLTAGRE